MLNSLQTVASVVLDHSECAQVFQQHRIDFCCRGELSIEAAAKEKGVDVGALIGELSRVIEQRQGAHPADLRELSTPQLVAHIVSKHHEYLRRMLPFARGMAAKVSRVHGDHNPKLRDLLAAVEELADSLGPHLDEEEQTLFPALVATQPDAAAVTKLLQSMHEEHLAVAQLLERIRAASDDFTLPDWACNSYRTLFSELEQLEGDVFTHVHLENHVLRPRFATQ
jgi:regulator of cell morphogenesis and NO signaling